MKTAKKIRWHLLGFLILVSSFIFCSGVYAEEKNTEVKEVKAEQKKEKKAVKAEKKESKKEVPAEIKEETAVEKEIFKTKEEFDEAVGEVVDVKLKEKADAETAEKEKAEKDAAEAEKAETVEGLKNTIGELEKEIEVLKEKE